MSRFFVHPEQIDQTRGEVLFDAGDSHHICQVLRMRAGDTVWALDGAGCEFEAQLKDVNKRQCRAAITARRALDNELRVQVTVAQALPKTLDKLEWVLQHGTEVGAAGFIVFQSARGRQDGERLAGKLSRWQEIVRSAAEQSHRAKLPAVDGILNLTGVLERARDFDKTMLAYEGEQVTRLREVIASGGKRILVLIGPEGGFNDSEVSQARAAGAVTVTLGPRILRTETAALVLLSQIAVLSGSP